MAKINILGVKVDLLTIQDLNSSIAKSISKSHQRVISNHNLHSIYLFHRVPAMRDFYSVASNIHIDGMPLVYWGKLLGYPVKKEHRVTYVDWIGPLIKISAEKKWRIFYLGGKPGVAEKAKDKLVQKYPTSEIYTHHGYFDVNGEENQLILQKITRIKPHILFVGMGMPRQELWILNNIEEISANIILPSGACFDYIAGEIPTPNRFIAKLGLEWLSRFIAEPSRLWKRYCVEPWFLIPLFIQDLLLKFTKRY